MAASIRFVRPLLASIRKNARIFVGSIALLLLAMGMAFCAPVSAQSTTTISGNVYAPNGVDPLVNVLVYVSTAPVDTPVAGANCPGVSCQTAANAIPSGVTLYAYSAVDGSFTLSNIPVSTSYTLVIQAGKWQRQFLDVSVGTTAISGLQLAMPTVHGTINTGSITSALPAAQTTGSVTTVNTIPLIAISTGAQDAMECVLRDVGIADSEFTDDKTATATTGGRIHLYQGDEKPGAYITTSTPNETTLMGGTSTTPLNDYDMAMFPCQGSTTTESAADIENLIAYTSAGGRVFATHDSLVWLNTSTSVPSGSFAGNTFSGAVNWLGTAGSNPADGEATINTGFTDGNTLAQWMLGIGASTTSGQVALSTLRDNISSVIAPTQSWVTLNSPADIMQITFNTPVGADAADQYGRVLFNEYHVEDGSTNKAFPAECGTSPYSVADPPALAPSAMSAQEKMLEYSLFDLSGFVTAVVPPTASISITTNPANGDFNEGDTADTIMADVTNTSATVAVPANTTFSITLPAGVTATAMTDSTGGWSCTVGTLTCTRSTTLAASTSDSVTVTVSVSSTATGGAATTTGNVTAQVASANFSSNVTSPITITLVQAAAASWATPAAITYGTALSGTQLDAVGNAPSGSYVYSPLSGTVLAAGSQTLSVTYTPDAAYTSTYPGTGTASVTLVVNPAAATVMLSGLAQNYTGSPIAASSTTDPESLPVTYMYTGIGATVYGPSATPPTAVGSYNVVATIASGQNYAGTTSGTLVISEATADTTSTSVQVLPGSLTVGSPATITATITDATDSGTTPTGSVTLTDTFGVTTTPLNGGNAIPLISGVATLPGVTLSGVGQHTITASYAAVTGFQASSNTATVDVVAASSPVGTATSSFPVTVTFTAEGTLGNIQVLTQGAPDLDFTDAVAGDTCSVETYYSAGATCVVNVIFTPKYAGQRYGAVVLEDGSGNLLATAYVDGVGTGPQITFATGGSSSPAPGATTNLGGSYNTLDSVAVDAIGNVYVADASDGVVQKIPFGGGTPINLGSDFSTPRGIAVDGAGNVYVTDGTVKEIPAAGGYTTVQTVGGGFTSPFGVAVDGAGNVYVSDGNGSVDEIPIGCIAGANNASCVQTLTSGLTYLAGVAVDGAGNVYVASNGGNAAGTVYQIMAVDGSIPASNPVINELGGGYFLHPNGVAVDIAGNVYVADTQNKLVRQIMAVNGSVPVNSTVMNNIFLSSSFPYPYGLALDALGNVYVAGGSSVEELNFANAPALSFAPTLEGGTNGPQTVMVSNIGNLPLSIASAIFPTDFPNAGSGNSDCAATNSLGVDAACTLAIDFTPTSAGPFNEGLVLTDNDLNGIAATQTIDLNGSLAVSATQAVASTVLTQGHAAVAFTPVTGSGGTGTLVYSVSPGLPATLVFDPSTGTITGTAAGTSSATSYTVTVTDANGATAQANFSLTVSPEVAATPVVASTVLTQGHAAVAFTPVTGSGGTGTLVYGVSPGLPTGLNFDTSTGTITGTAAGTSSATSYTVTVTDANGATAQANFSLTVSPAVAATPVVASTVLTQGHAAVAFTPVTGSGGTGTLVYGVSPGLPTGLNFDTSTGTITGTATGISSATSYTVTVTDANGATAQANFSLTVSPAVAATPVVASTVLTQGHAAVAFTPVTGSGGTGTLVYGVSPGLPTGLNFNTSTGTITGTATGTSGATNYTVTVTDANNATAQASFSLTVNAAVAATQAVASTTLTQEHAAVAFTPVTGSGGTGTLVYGVSPGLPAGLSFSSSTGAITGTAVGTSSATSYTVTVTDANGATAQANFSLTVSPAVAATPVVASTTLTQGHAAVAFTPVTGSGGTGTLVYGVSPGLPTGLNFNTSTGTITGTATGISSATSYTVTVTDANGATAQANFSLTVSPAVAATPVVASTTLTFYQSVTPFVPVVGSSGTAPLSYSVSPGLPAGLVFDPSTGTISGTPTVVSSATSYTVTVTDANNATAQANFSLGVAQQASVTVVSANPTTATPVQSVTLTAMVSPAISGTPGPGFGAVTFFDGTTQLGESARISGGMAQLVVPSLPPGQTAVITAVYTGDGNFLGGTSGNSASVVVGPLDYTFTNSGASAYTAAPGAVASYSFALAPLYGTYAGPVSFTVTGLPAGAVASFTPSAVAADGGAVPVAMTVQTAAPLAHNGNNGPLGRGVVLALLLLPFGMKRRVREKLKGRLLLLVLLLAGTTAMVSGCGSNNGFMLQSPGTYTLTVTASSGTLEHSQIVTLTVQ